MHSPDFLWYNKLMDNKTYIQITEIPKLMFAHIFGIDQYYVKFDPLETKYQFIEITYITKGEFNIIKADGSVSTAPTRSLICRVQQEAHFIESTAYHEHHTVGVHLPFRMLTDDEIEVREDEGPPGRLCLPWVIPALPENNKFLPLIDKIILSHTMHNTGSLGCSAMVLELLDMIDRHTREEQVQPTYMNRKYVKKAKEYIFEHLKEPIHQGDVAEELGITSEYLCNVFKKSEGMSVMQFINRVKLEQIRVLMENNAISLSKASEMYGYSDPNYVSRLHKRYFQCTITEALRRNSDGRVQWDT